MKLVIVESPTKAVTIGKFLGKDYKVESSYGHVRDLPRSRFGIDLEHNFEPQYIIPVKARKRVTELKKIAARAKEIILASDEDREGEAIAWHLKQVLLGEGLTAKQKTKTQDELHEKIKDIPMSRIVFHEITESAIHHALETPREIDLHLVDAQQARRVLDRLVGYKLSPFLWKKIAKGLSAGRVQSVALRLIVDRENEIRVFKPEEYWTIEAIIADGRTKKTFEASLSKIDGKPVEKFDIKTKDGAEKIAGDLRAAQLKVVSIKQSEVRKNPLPPFTTSTLQQTASSRLGYSAKKTMMLAQRLYENGYITYMRTDAVNLSKDSVIAAATWLRTELGSQYALPEPRLFKGKSKLAQEAHEAIRPTKMTKVEEIEASEEAERRLYKLIWQRFVASQMPQAVFSATQADIEAKLSDTRDAIPDTHVYTLRANGNILKFDGFLKIYPQKFDEKELPALTENEMFTAKPEIKPNQHFTEPPPRYSEARLIKTLEEYGIGRPSTYVPIISVIQSRNYVRKDGGKFVPTEIGELVNKILTEHFPQIVDVNFTAQMEESLDRVAEGTEEWHDLLGAFYGPFEKNLEKKYAEVEKEFPEEKTNEVCECMGKSGSATSKCLHEGLCGKPMVIKFGRFGKFLACTGFPDCKNTKTVGANAPPSTGLKCPKCGQGDIVQKQVHKGRRRIFWGCSRYPDCDWASWKDPTKPAGESTPPPPEAVEAEETS